MGTNHSKNIKTLYDTYINKNVADNEDNIEIIKFADIEDGNNLNKDINILNDNKSDKLQVEINHIKIDMNNLFTYCYVCKLESRINMICNNCNLLHDSKEYHAYYEKNTKNNKDDRNIYNTYNLVCHKCFYAHCDKLTEVFYRN